MEEYLSSHSNESSAGVFSSHGSSVALVAKPLVEIQVKSTNATGGEDGAMEDLPGRFFGVSIVCIG